MDPEFYEQLQKQSLEAEMMEEKASPQDGDADTATMPESQPVQTETATARRAGVEPTSRPRRKTQRRGDNQPVDWVAIAPNVAIQLKGERNPRLSDSKEWRWGNRGSFSLNLEKGLFSDFESQEGGNVIKMVMHCEGLDRRGAVKWLQDNDFLSEHKDTRPRQSTPQVQTRRRQSKATEKPHDVGQLKRGLQLWESAESIPNNPSHPVQKWLSKSNLLSPDNTAPPQIRFHPGKRLILAIMASLEEWGKSLATHELPTPQAIHTIAIDENGDKRMAFGNGTRDKTSYGKSPHTLVFMIGQKDGKRVNICEGVGDALAVRRFASSGCVLATITVISKVVNDRKFVEALARRETHIYSDMDDAGKQAAEKLATAITNRGGTVKIHQSSEKDPKAEIAKRKDYQQ